MERKISLVIGPRTRQDILKGKNIRKLKDGGDNFEDYWTDSDGESSTVSKSSSSTRELTAEQPIVQSSNFFNASQIIETCSSPLKAKAVHSPLTRKTVHSPLTRKTVHSPLTRKTVHSPLKTKNVQSPFKSKKVLPGDTENADKVVKVNKETYTEFEDVTVNLGVNDDNGDNDDPESEVLNRILDNIARNNISKVPSADIQEIHNANNSPLTDTHNSAEIKEIHNTNNSSQSLTYDKKSEVRVSRISLKGSKKSISRSTKKDSKIKELKLQYDEYDKKMMQMIHRNNDENERISSSSEEDMPLAEQKSAFMEKKKTKSKVVKQTVEIAANFEDKENFSDDESINENIKKSIKLLDQSVSDSESLSFENTPVKKTKITSKHNKNQKISLQDNYFPHSNCSGKKTGTTADSQLKKKSSETFISKKNLIAGGSHTADISVNSYEDSSYSELHNDTGETQTDEQAPVNNDSLSQNSLNMPLNSGNTNDDVDSETDSPLQHSSKNVMLQSLDSSCDSNSAVEMSKLHKIDAFSKSNDSVEITASNNGIFKNASEDVANMNTSNTTSEIRMIAKEKKRMKNNKNDSIPDENLNATDFNETSHFRSNKRQKKIVSSLPDRNDVANRSVSFSEDSINVSEGIMEKPVKKQKKNDNDKKRIKETRKTHSVEITSSNNGISKNASEDVTNMNASNTNSEARMIAKKKERMKNDSIPDENLNATDFNETSHFRSNKRQKKIVSSLPDRNDVANRSVSFSEDSINVSEGIMEKPVKKQKKNDNDKRRIKETRKTHSVEITSSNNGISKNASEDVTNMNASNTNSEVRMIAKKKERMKNDSIPDENLNATDFDETSHFRSNKRQKKIVSSLPDRNDVANRSVSFSEDSINVSEGIMEKPAKKQKKNDNDKRRIKETRKTPLILHEDIVEKINLDSSSQLQTSKKRRTRNCSTAEEIDFANMQLINNNISEVNQKKTYRKQKKIANNKNRQKSPTNKSDFMSYKDISERDDLSLSHSHNSSSHHNSTTAEKTAKKQRKNRNSEGKADTSQKQTNWQETVSTRNSFISEENDHAVASANSSKDCSVKNVSEINKKKATKRQGKVKSDKNIPLHDEHYIEDKTQYKVPISGKSKSKLPKNNIDKENEKSNYGGLRRSTRERYAPLARWRNERLIFSFKNGQIETLGIDKGTKEDTDFLQSLYKKVNKKQKEKKPKRVEILDVIENKKKKINLQKKFSLIPWGSPSRCNTEENPSHAFLIKRMLETDKNSFGYIHIDVGKTKPPQYMPDEDLSLTVIEGKVEIYIHDEVFTLERKDLFNVPRGTAYSIINIGNRRALLSYVVGDFKFFDYI